MANLIVETNFLRAVRNEMAGAVRCRLQVGRSVIVVDSKVPDRGGTLVSRVTQTHVVLGK
jgi:acyl-coenzyme A thioesterase PaaI-like protein